MIYKVIMCTFSPKKAEVLYESSDYDEAISVYKELWSGRLGLGLDDPLSQTAIDLYLATNPNGPVYVIRRVKEWDIEEAVR